MTITMIMRRMMVMTVMIRIIAASSASPMLLTRHDDDHDDNGARGRDDRYHPRHDSYHYNILCISTCSLITVIIAFFALPRMSNVPFDFSICNKILDDARR